MDLRDKLKLMLLSAAKKEKEPIWCEYLESDGRGQYIDTGVIDDGEKTFNVTFSPTMLDNVSNVRYFGATNGLWVALKSSLTLGIGGADIVTAQPDTKYTFKLYRDEQGRRSCDYNGTKYTGTPNESGYRYSLFNVRAGGTEFISRVYSFQAYKGSKLIRNFRPCLHPDTLRPAMYDTVGKIYYYNIGTGEFKYKISFTKLDYIDSDGNQYIDTGYITNNTNYQVDLKMKKLGNRSAVSIFGAQNSDAVFAMFFADTPIRPTIYAGNNYYSVHYYEDIEIYKMKLNLTEKKIICDINGIVKITQTDGILSRINTPMGIFCNNISSNPFGQRIDARLWYFSLRHNGILVRDYIPVRMNDGQIGLWDYIEGKFYANAGTGKFKGYLNGYQVGESLESNGKQYIDTKIRGNVGYTSDLIFKQNSTGTARIMGVYAQSSNVGACYALTFASNFWIFKAHKSDANTVNLPIINLLKHEVSINNKGLVYFDNDNPIKAPNWASDFDLKNNVYLFTLNYNNEAPSRSLVGNIYYFFIGTNDNKPLRLFIPVQKDGFIGMVDTLTGKEYPNLGTGSFIFNE